MAEPITNLTSVWVSSQGGIQLRWDAATDVTVNSIYEIYVLQNTGDPFPSWVQVTTLKSNIVRTITATSYVLEPPANSFFYNFPNTVTPVNSYAFMIIHIDDTGAQSQATTISAFQPVFSGDDSSPHLTNNIALDPFGQFTTNPQDSYEEISDSVGVLVGTIIGQRTMVPDYGIEDLPFNEIDPAYVESVIGRWEPRAKAKVSIVYDDKNNAVLSVDVIDK